MTGFDSRRGSFVVAALRPLAAREIQVVVGFRMISVADDSKWASPAGGLHSCLSRPLREATSDRRKAEHYQLGEGPSSQTLTDGKIPPD